MQVPELRFFDASSAAFLATFNTYHITQAPDDYLTGLSHFLSQISNFSGVREELLTWNFDGFESEPFLFVDMRIFGTELLFDEAALALANKIPLQFPCQFAQVSDHLRAYLLREQGKKYELALEIFDSLPDTIYDAIEPFTAFSFPVFEEFDSEIVYGCPELYARTLTRGHVYFTLYTGGSDPAAFVRYFVKQKPEFAYIGAKISSDGGAYADENAMRFFEFWTGNLAFEPEIIDLRRRAPIKVRLCNNYNITMRTPCRTDACTHYYPFDKDDYVRAGKCPHCGQAGYLYCDKWLYMAVECLVDEFPGYIIKEIVIDPLTFVVLDVVARQEQAPELVLLDD